MKKLLLSLLAFVALGGSMQAQVSLNEIEDAVAVDDVEYNGDEVAITFKMTKLPTDGCRGLQFDLYLPKNLQLKTRSNGKPIATVCDDQTPEGENFTINSNTLANDDYNDYRFIFTSYDGDFLHVGDVFKVTLARSESVVPGVYDAYVAGLTTTKNIDISGKDGNDTWIQKPFTFRIMTPIVYDEGDEEENNTFVGQNDVKVTMKRTVTAGSWNTICLPFDMSAEKVKEVFGEDTKLATYSSYTATTKDGKIQNISLSFATTSELAISAHTPYLINAANSTDATEGFVVEGVSISDGSPISGEFVGIYNKQTIGSADAPVLYISGNIFYISQGVTMKGFRGYFDIPELKKYVTDHASANVSFFVDGEPTGIKSATINNSEEGAVYDLQGRKINSDKSTLQKGVYIINGKKETIR